MKGQTFKIGNATIIVRDSTPKEDDIRRCYDVCNELFAGKPECFYTKEEVKEKNRILSQSKNKIE